MLYKCTVMFCVCVIGVAMADKRQPDGEPATKRTFAETFRNVALEAKILGSTLNARRLLPYTARLAGKDAQVDVAFLRQVVKSDKDATRVSLAALVLARTGGKEASDCLYTLLGNNPWVAGEVGFYMSPKDVRDAAERVLANRKEAKLQFAAATWLALVGDKNSLALLKRMSVGVDDATTRRMLNIAISRVTRRLNDAPKGRELQWARQELRFARARKERAGDHGPPLGGIAGAAELLAGEEPLSVPFLRSKIKSGDMLAVMVAGRQRETHLVDDVAKSLEKLLDNPGRGWRRIIPMDSLARIGNAAAMDALAKRMKPGAIEVNKSVADVLAESGTESSIALLEKLSEDKDYKASWPAFKKSLKILKARHRQKHRNPESQPSTAPAATKPASKALAKKGPKPGPVVTPCDRPGVTLQKGESYDFVFDRLDYQRKQSILPQVVLYLGKGVGQIRQDQHFTYQLFSNNFTEEPFATGTDPIVSCSMVSSAHGNAWQDMQGALRLTVTSGTITFNSLWIKVYTGTEVYQSTFRLTNAPRADDANR